MQNNTYMYLSETKQNKRQKYGGCVAAYFSDCNRTDSLINTEALFSHLCKVLYTQ